MAQVRLGIEHIPPQALEAEMAVLGAILLDRDAIARALEIIDDKCFYSSQHCKIFNAVISLYDRNEAVDLITLTEELRKSNDLDAVGGITYLESVLSSVATSANIEHHAKIVLEKSTLRRLIEASTQIINESYNGQIEVAELIDRAERRIFEISGSKLRKGFVAMQDIIKDSFELVEQLYQQKRYVTGLESGFKDLDTMTAGFHAGDFVVVAGRPSMGKTSFALNIAQHVAIKHKIPVAVFSLEMTKEQLMLRVLCSEARVKAHSVRTGFVGKNEWGKLTRAAGALHDAPIYIDDSADLNVLEMRAKARRLKSEVDLGLVIVDYLQLIRGHQRAENRQQEISHISRSLKALAKELSIPVMALSQLSRAVEQRERKEKRPILSDLRESGAIEQDADVVIFIYRPFVYKQSGDAAESGDAAMAEDRRKAEIIVGKQRNGPTGHVDLIFFDEYTRFEDKARVETERE
ncbi:MAG: replicative DNA helicase [Candidatus Eisenbacteria bacterium]